MNSKQQTNTEPDRKNGRFASGSSGNPSGRPKGSANRITVQMREAFSMALDELGGVEYLVKFGQQNPKAFITLLSKMLPREVHVGPVGEPSYFTGEEIERMKRRGREMMAQFPRTFAPFLAEEGEKSEDQVS